MALMLLSALKHGLLFAYGTSQDVANDHHPQSRAVAYTIGGLLVFVTLPFLFGGTVYLLHDELASISSPVLRWTGILVAAALITTAVLWVERALLVLSDAIWPHFSAQLAMLLIRVGMVFLFSVVIAQKWVLNSYAGPIQKELVAMANEAQELERKNATATFNVDVLEKRLSTAQDRTRELELRLTSLPSSIVSDTERLHACKVESTRLNAERNEMRRIPNKTEAQSDRLRVLEVSSRAKMTDCHLKEQSINTAVRAYKEPIETELASVRTTASEVAITHATAEKSAAEQATERANKSAQALHMNGADQEAFTRVRAKNPDIDLEVRKKTLLLAALELLPLLLKLLTYNSPIAMEARALLQQESAAFRALSHQSIENEKTRKTNAIKAAPPSTAGWGYATASPCVVPTPSAPPSFSGAAGKGSATAGQQ
jgi:hypothetical protein